MNDQELKNLWQQQTLAPLPHRTDQELVERMKRMMRRFDRTILWRDLREIGACALLALLVGLGMLHKTSVLTRIGDVIIMCGCAIIALTLIVVRRRRRAPVHGESLRDYLLAQFAKVDRQIRLLQTVVWWYAAPLLLGAALAELGHQGGLIGNGIAIILLALAGWFIHRFNRRGLGGLVRLKADLERTLNAIPEFSAQQQSSNSRREQP